VKVYRFGSPRASSLSVRHTVNDCYLTYKFKEKKMKNLLILLVISLLILAFGCAPMPNVQPKQKSNLTVGMVKTKVIKGETNRTEILELFGAPNLVTKNKNDDEVWNYNKMSFESGSGSSSDVWLGSRVLSTSTTSSFDLIIIFDNDGIVKEYSIISASY